MAVENSFSIAFKCYSVIFLLICFWLIVSIDVCPNPLKSALHSKLWFTSDGNPGPVTPSATCPQADELSPLMHYAIWKKLSNAIDNDPHFKASCIDWISGAVQINTEGFDDFPPVQENPEVWKHFRAFHDYLQSKFPLVHSTLSLQKVNTYGLLYVWQGQIESLKPILFMGHQDTVPVEMSTIDKWTHPPWSGHYDGEYVWGRGSSDDKSGVIGTLIAVETLISMGFTPDRTVVLSFGFDEEISGTEGARYLSQKIRDMFGEDSFAFLIDEGGGYMDMFESTFAFPGVGEKGYLDVRVEVSTPGGHSSVPPSHTGIGILSHIIYHLENHPYRPHLVRGSIAYDNLQCQAAHAVGIPTSLKALIAASQYSDAALFALQEAVSADPMMKSLISTTQAVDVIAGGAKVNALPETSWAIVNHRIAPESSVQAIQNEDTSRLLSLVNRYNLTYSAFGYTLVSDLPSSGSLTLTDAFNTALEPAPRTPTDADSAPWQLLSGTIKTVYNQRREDEIIVSPGMDTGNTDTQFYWNITSHIFRYSHDNGKNGDVLHGIHTVNERLHVDSFLEQIYFFATLILNADESRQI